MEVAYSREAMRALLMLDVGERGRAIETIEKLANAYDALCAEQDIVAMATASADENKADETAAQDNTTTAVAAGKNDFSPDETGKAETIVGTAAGNSNNDEASSVKPDDATPTSKTIIDETSRPTPPPVIIPGTLALGSRGQFCIAPFSETGDFVVALDDDITVVSLINVAGDLYETRSQKVFL